MTERKIEQQEIRLVSFQEPFCRALIARATADREVGLFSKHRDNPTANQLIVIDNEDPVGSPRLCALPFAAFHRFLLIRRQERNLRRVSKKFREGRGILSSMRQDGSPRCPGGETRCLWLIRLCRF